MNVLVLGNNNSAVTTIVRESSCSAMEYSHKFNVEFFKSHKVDFIVSYGYRHIISETVLDFIKDKVINLHISYLPWNRGADPNLWSFLEDTPKGVSIHFVDKGLDTGDLIAQKEVVFDEEGETLATTYDKLSGAILELFRLCWPTIVRGKAPRQQQPPGGSYHRLADKEKYMYLLAQKGWNTPVVELIGKAL